MDAQTAALVASQVNVVTWVIAGLTLMATLLGPILALWVNRALDAAREERQRQQLIFETLVLTRRTAISPDHVRALNQIEITFANDREVIESIRRYFDYLDERAPTDSELFTRYQTRGRRLFASLVQIIGQRLGRAIDKMDLMEGGYYPQGLVDLEMRQRDNAELLSGVLRGSAPLTVALLGVQRTPGAQPSARAGRPAPNNPFPPPP